MAKTENDMINLLKLYNKLLASHKEVEQARLKLESARTVLSKIKQEGVK